MKALTFVLVIVALHLGVASAAASRHLLWTTTSLPLLSCDPAR